MKKCKPKMPECGDLYLNIEYDKIVEFGFMTYRTFFVYSQFLEEKYTVRTDTNAIKVFNRRYFYIGKL